MRAVLLWLAIGVVTMVCSELLAQKQGFYKTWDRPSMGEHTAKVLFWPLLWPFLIAFAIHAIAQAMHGDDSSKEPPKPPPDA